MVKSCDLIGCSTVRNPPILDSNSGPYERLWTGKLKNVNKRMLSQERKIEREQKAKTETKQNGLQKRRSSKPNRSEYFERIGNHVNVCSCQNLTVTRTYNNSTHAKPPVPFTKSCQWPILHFCSWIKKIQQNLNAFAGRVPCNNWTLGNFIVNGTPAFGNSGTLRIGDEESHDTVQNVFACVSKHYSQYRERIKSNLSEYLLGRIRSRAQKLSLYGNLRRFSRMK